MNQISTLPSRTPYVMSFVELWEWGIVVRIVGLTDGFIRQVLDMEIELRDDEGRMYPYRATTSGGMVLAEEVMTAFEGKQSKSARVLQLSAASGDVLVSVAIPAS